MMLDQMDKNLQEYKDEISQFIINGNNISYINFYH